MISRSFTSQKVLEAMIEIIDDTDSSVSAVKIETGARTARSQFSSRPISPHFTVQLSRFCSLATCQGIFCWKLQLKILICNVLEKILSPSIEKLLNQTLKYFATMKFNLVTWLPAGKNCASYLFISAFLTSIFWHSAFFPSCPNALWAFGMQNE